MVYALTMNTYEILNAVTNEVAETATSYTDAIHIAAHLTDTTRVLHFVPIVEREFEFAV